MAEIFIAAATMVLGGGAAAAVNKRQKKKREAFTAQFGSFEEFRRAADPDRIRAIRDDQGELVAVKVVRQEFPGIPLEYATRFVKQL